MVIKAHPILGEYRRAFLVICESPKEIDALMRFGVKENFKVFVEPSKPVPHINPSGPVLSEAVDEFIKRVLMGNCTQEETRILPDVLDRLYGERPGDQRR